MRYYESVHPGLYRSRDGMLFGVCSGLAEYLDTNVFWTRVAVVLLAVFTAFWPAVLVYGIAALLMKKAPYSRW